MTQEHWRLGLDLGGTGCRAVALDQQGAVIASATRRTPAQASRNAATRFLMTLIEDLGRPNAPLSVGIGASGPIDTTGTIQNPDTLPAFTGLPLVDDLQTQLGVTVKIDNDAVTAAIAEQQVGAARGVPAFLHVTLGTGVGVSMLTAAGPFRGADGTHPEASHFNLRRDTPPCYCGRAACFEQGAARGTLQRSAAAHLGLAADDVTAIPRANRAARSGDREALRILENYAATLAEGLSTLMSVFRPPLIVPGGSGAGAFDSFKRVLEESLIAPQRSVLPALAVTALDDYGGAIGAANLVDRN